MSTYRRMLRYLRPHVWPYGVLAVVFMLAFSGLESSIPFLIKFTFDQVFTKQRAEMLHLAVAARPRPLASSAAGWASSLTT